MVSVIYALLEFKWKPKVLFCLEKSISFFQNHCMALTTHTTVNGKLHSRITHI